MVGAIRAVAAEHAVIACFVALSLGSNGPFELKEILMNRLHWTTLVAPALVLALLGTGCTMDMASISPEARTAVETRFPDAEVQEVEAEGSEMYEIELTDCGASREVKVHKDGTIVEIETEIDAAELPKPVAEIVAEKSGGRPLTEVQKVEVLADSEIYYEIEWKTGLGEQEIEVNPDGTLR
jgi:hypothetical protein